MPIKRENRHRYPPEWPEIRARVLRESRHRCEWAGCGAVHHSLGQWISKPRGWTFEPCYHHPEPEFRRAARAQLGYREARELAVAANARNSGGWPRFIVIVLTIAHLDHRPDNCGRSNLAAWCQRHHLAYDQEHHQQTRYMARKALDGTGDLFQQDMR